MEEFEGREMGKIDQSHKTLKLNLTVDESCSKNL